MIIPKNGKGLHKTMIGKKNRKLIEKYFEKNPDSTLTECMNTLGLSIFTIKSHIEKINEQEKNNLKI